jgi:hypothetical protein
MSRVGKIPVIIPDKVKVDIKGHTVSVEGPKGKVSKTFAPVVSIVLANKTVTVAALDDSRFSFLDRPKSGPVFLVAIMAFKLWCICPEVGRNTCTHSGPKPVLSRLLSNEHIFFDAISERCCLAIWQAGPF